MSITYYGAKNGGLEFADNGDMSTSRILVYHFNAGESAAEIAKQSEIPARGTAHPDNATLKLRSYSISAPTEGDTIKSGKYEVTLNYTRTAASGNTEKDASVAPWKRRPYDISFPSVTYVVPFVKGYDTGDTKDSPSVPVLNAAGDPFEDSVERERRLIKFSYNLKTFPFTWQDQFCDTINLSPVTIMDVLIPARFGRIKQLFPSLQEEYDADGDLQYSFWKVDVEMEVNSEEYKKEIMQRGLFALGTADTISTKYRIYIDSEGTMGNVDDCDSTKNPVPVDEPQRLNTDGTLYNTNTDGAYYATFYDKFAQDWSPLNFPKTVKA